MSGRVYRIDGAVFGLCPGYRRGVIAVGQAENRPASTALQAALRQTEAELRQRLAGRAVTDLPEIAAWREAFRAFGARPSEHRSAVEALLRRVLKPDALPAIHALVDIGNLISLQHLLPAGVHPWPEGDEPIMLRPAGAGDTFFPPDGSPAEFPPAGEVVLSQGQAVLTRRWVWRQAAATQTRLDTRAVFFNLDALPCISDATLQTAMDALCDWVRSETGAQIVHRTVLSAQQPGLVLSGEV